jgi:hypothetical protein
MSGPCGLLTQGPRIAHLSSDAELKIGSHIAELGCVNDLGQFLGLLIRQRWLLDGGR